MKLKRAIFVAILTLALSGIVLSQFFPSRDRNEHAEQVQALLQQAELALANEDLVGFVRSLDEASGLSPNEPRIQQLRATHRQAVAEAGRRFLVHAARSVASFNLEDAEAALATAELLLPAMQDTAFVRESLAASQGERFVCGPRPSYMSLHAALRNHVRQTNGSLDTQIISWKVASRPHEYQGELYWVIRVEHETRGRQGILTRHDDVVYIRQERILHVRDFSTGQVIYHSPPAGVAAPERPLTQGLLSLVSRLIDIYRMHWVATLLTSGETAEYSGYTYERVADARFPTFADYEEYLRQTFVTALAEQYLRDGPYSNINGKLFVSSGNRGAAYDIDLFRMNILRQQENYVEVELLIPSKWNGPEQRATIEFVKHEGRWLILSKDISF